MQVRRWVFGCALMMVGCGRIAGVNEVITITEPPGPSSPPKNHGPSDPNHPGPTSVPVNGEESGNSSCASAIPAHPSAACQVGLAPGASYYVSSANGADTNDGRSTETPFATMGAALRVASAGENVLVAEGDYVDAELRIDEAIAVRGGYDPTFTSWNPDVYSARFHGQLTMRDDAAIFGGFRMLGHASVNKNGNSFHQIAGGTLVRNHIEVVYDAQEGAWSSSAIETAPEWGRRRVSSATTST